MKSVRSLIHPPTHPAVLSFIRAPRTFPRRGGLQALSWARGSSLSERDPVRSRGPASLLKTGMDPKTVPLWVCARLRSPGLPRGLANDLASQHLPGLVTAVRAWGQGGRMTSWYRCHERALPLCALSRVPRAPVTSPLLPGGLQDAALAGNCPLSTISSPRQEDTHRGHVPSTGYIPSCAPCPGGRPSSWGTVPAHVGGGWPFF